MKRILLLVTFLCLSQFSNGQLTVTNTQTPAQLVQNVLLGSGITVSNIEFNGSVANANGIRDQAAEFGNGASTNIGINNGVLLTTGQASLAIGPNNAGGATMPTSNPVPGDPDLAILAAPSNIQNAAILEFDFVPLGEDLTFNFVFASEEWPVYANSSFNDAFGFFLSGPGITGPFTGGAANIAIIPGSVPPTAVTINNLNNGNGNAGPCEYCAFYVNNTGGATIQYNAFTTVLTASATVQCGETYHIKLAIANVGDNALDSGVFLQAGSFNTSPLSLPDDYLISNGFAQCPGSTVTICSGLGDAVPHVWTLDGVVIPGVVGECLDITQPGEYCVTAYPYGPACPVTDCIIIEYQPPIPLLPPLDMCEDDGIFNLTLNEPVILGALNPANFFITYYATQAAADNAFPALAGSMTAYTGVDGEIVYIRVENFEGCYVVTSFQLNVPPAGTSCCPAQTPPDMIVCDDASNDGFAAFDLSLQNPFVLGSANASDYTITYHLSQADADAGVGAINPITAFTNTINPQTIFVHMVENADPTEECTRSFQLIVNALPTATISGSTTMCSGATSVITFTGTPGATVNYSVDGGPSQPIILSATGTNTVTTPVLTVTTVYTLVNILNTVTTCTQTLSGSATVTVNPSPTATISGTASICQNGASPIVTFTAAGGTAPYTFTYNIGTGPVQTITTTAGNTATISVPTGVIGTYVYNLLSVQSGGVPGCSQNQSGSATVTVGTLPTAIVSGTTSVCQNATGPVITFTGANGTPPYTFTYSIDAGPNQTVTTAAGSNSVTVTAPTGTIGVFDYCLVSVSANSCSQAQTTCAIITVTSPPTATIAGSATVCQNAAPVNITFTAAGGTAPYTFTYTLNSVQQTVTTTSGSSVTVSAPTTATGVFSYAIESVQDATGCSQTQSGSAVVTVIALPTATVSGATEVCQNGASPTITFTGAGGTAPYTFTYSINAGAAQTITTTVGNSVTVTAPTGVAGTFDYCLVSVQGSGTTPCMQNQTGCATITISPLPTASISGTTSVCQGATGPMITFTGAGGNAPYTFTYNIGSGAPLSVTTTSGSSVTVTAVTTSAGIFNYNLISVSDSGTVSCSQLQSATATITVTAPPTALISGTASVCQNDTQPLITFTGAGGTPPYTVTYTINTGSPLSATTTTGNSVTVNAPTGATGVFTYDIVSIQDALGCSQNQTGSAAITVLALPTATISGTAEVCQDGASPSITFTGATGTAPYTFNYSIDGGTAQSVTTTSGNSITVAAPTDLAGTFTYTLISVQGSGTTPCFQNQSGSVTVTVNPLPTATISGTTAVCQDSAGPAITFTGAGGTPPYTFTYNIGGGPGQSVTTTSGSSVTVIADTSTPGAFDYNLISVSDSSATLCSQTQTGTATITVNTPPVIFTPQPIQVCDDNNDGFSCTFQIDNLEDEITGGATGLTVTFHETEQDAISGANPILTPTYCNIVAGIQTLYVSVSTQGSSPCKSYTTLTLQVNPVPVANPVIEDYELCDVNNPGDGIEGFDLASMNTEILNAQTGITVTYYTSQADALVPVNAIDTSVLYNNTTPGGEPVWVRLESAAGCFDVTSFNIVVNALPVVTAPEPMTLCATTGSAPTASFDLSVNNNIISGGIPGVSVSYHLTLADAQNDVNALSIPYTNISNPQTIYVRGENSSTGCFDTTTLTLNVNQGPAANTPDALEECDPNNDGFTTFDLTQAYSGITGTPLPPGVVITFHETAIDAQNGVNPISSPYSNIVADNQTIYANVFYNTPPGCQTFVSLELIVHETPQGTEIDPLEVCDNDDDGIGTFDLTQATPGILGSLNAAGNTVTYYVLPENAQAQTNPITNVLAFNNSTPDSQIIWVTVTDNVTGCFDILPLELIVNPLPLAPTPAVAPYTLCDVTNTGDEVEEFDLSTMLPQILMGQTGMEVNFYLTLADAQAGLNPLANLYTNVANAQTIFVVVGNQDTSCFVITTMDLRVEPLPALIPPSGPVTECDPDGDGIAIFDLDALTEALLQGAPGVTVNYYETEQDAIDGVNAIDASQPYTNIAPFVQFLWVGAQITADPQCRSTLMIELNVVASPNVPVLDDLTACDEDANAQNGFTSFDLTVQTPIVLAAQMPPTAGYVVGYYLTLEDAQAGTDPIIPANNYINISNPQTIYVGIHAGDNECFDTGSFELMVDVPLALTTPSPLSLCDDGPTTAIPQMVFDLTVKNDEITQNLPGYTVAYYPSYADALAGTNPISATQQTAYTNLSNPQTLGVVVTNDATGCKSYITLDIRVLPLPNPQPNPPALEVCDDTLPVGTEIFDLTLNEDYFSNGDPNLTYTYYSSEADAQNQVNPIVDPTAFEGSTMVWIVVANNQVSFSGENCSVIVTQELIINPLPVVDPATDFILCDTTATGTGVFTLSDHNEFVLLTPQLLADFTITYHGTLADAQAGVNPLPNNYTNLTNPQDIYVHVQNNDTDCVSTAVVTLIVAQGAVSTAPASITVCASNLTQQAILDLPTLFDLQILGAQAAPQFTVSYFATMADAQANTNVIANPTVYATGSTTMFGVVNNTATGCQSEPSPIVISVQPLPNPVITANTDVLCVDFGSVTPNQDVILNSGLGAGFTFQWMLNGAPIAGAIAATYTISDVSPGSYTVVATSTTGLMCASPVSQPFNVILSGAPQILTGTAGFTINNYFAENQIITVLVQGNGQYVYSLDGGPFLDNGGVFTGVGPGEHYVVVHDQNACTDDLMIDGIMAINYPHYFTPNGDGIHDTWNIIGLENQTGARIHIFDRYGKLIKQIAPDSPGWDGTYNGEQLPSTDYWFTVTYGENGAEKEFKAHFSLKR